MGSRSELVRKILIAVEREKDRRTENIVNSVGIEEEMAKEYLSKLTEEGMLEKHESETSYKITERGKSLLKSYEKLENLSSVLLVI